MSDSVASMGNGLPVANPGPPPNWTVDDMPAQVGKLAVETGGAAGIGLEISLALAHAGADVILAGPSEAEAHVALGRIRPQAPWSLLRFEKLDLASLASVEEFAGRLAQSERRVDLLVNNAGVLGLPERQVTEDGFERQLAINYLGHYALTARLMPLLRRGNDPRVVHMTGTAYRFGAIHHDDLQLERSYGPLRAYTQSKLAVLLFALELQRRNDACEWGIISLAAHPGYARTGLFSSGPGARSGLHLLHRLAAPWISQTAAGGALPALYAATAVKARPGMLYGPKGVFGMEGPTGVASIGKNARDKETARILWETSERLTRVRWPGKARRRTATAG